MKQKYINLLRQGMFSDNYDPTGSYTGNYLIGYEEDNEPEQDADDL